MKLTTATFAALICFCCKTITAQTYYCGLTYYYDNGGNRIQRITTPLTACNESSKTEIMPNASKTVKESTNGNLQESLFPNPTSGEINILFNTNVTDAQITIADNMGRKLFTTKSSGTSIPLDISDYPPGVYYISVQVGHNKFHNAVIKN